jgi:hypothetical protein
VLFEKDGEIQGSNTFENLTFSPGKTYILSPGSTQTITPLGNFIAEGYGGFPIEIKSSSLGQQATLYKDGDPVCLDFLYLTDIAAAGTAFTYAGANSDDVFNNSGWLFEACPGCFSAPPVAAPTLSPFSFIIVPGGHQATLILQNRPAGYEAVWFDADQTIELYAGTENFFQPTVNGNTIFYGAFRDLTTGCISELLAVEVCNQLLINPLCYLQGPYDPVTGLMQDDLRANDLLPLTEPYTALGFIHFGGGGENVQQSVFEVTGPEAIIDWVFLELRDKTDATTVLATRSALLQADGDVVDTDGVSPVTFAGLLADEYYLVIKHRNHLGVMSAAPVSVSCAPIVVDFTTDLNQIAGDANGIAMLPDGKLGLFSGDFNGNGQVQNTDYATMVLTLGLAGYQPGDFDLNGQVQNTDLQLKLVPNIGRGAAFP